MKANQKISTPIGLKVNQDELAMLEWLMKETSRTRSGAIKWACLKAAKELGYVPPKKKTA